MDHSLRHGASMGHSEGEKPLSGKQVGRPQALPEGQRYRIFHAGNLIYSGHSFKSLADFVRDVLKVEEIADLRDRGYFITVPQGERMQ